MNPGEVSEVHLQTVALLDRSSIEKGLGVAKVSKARSQVIEGAPDLRIVGCGPIERC